MKPLSILALGCLLSCVVGCMRGKPEARVMIETPEGGPAVLTTEERAAKAATKSATSPATPKNQIAQVSFEQPAEEPQVLRPMQQWTEQEAAADALGRIGQAAVPELMPALVSPDPNIKLKAIEVLGRMGPEAQGAVPVLTTLLQDPEERIRKATARTLGQIGPAAKDAVPSLIRTLVEPSTTTAQSKQG
jgi:hypothetical protein